MKFSQRLLIVLTFALAPLARGQTLEVLPSFNGTNGANPAGKLVQGSDGDFYGTTVQGGANNYYGTVFKMTTNGALTTLVSFTGTNGSDPRAGLIQWIDGSLYGTTFYGGSNDVGTVFKLTTNGALTTLVSFTGTNGSNPRAGLILGADGNFYGTTTGGGTNAEALSVSGTVFQMTPLGSLTTLVTFIGANGSDPTAPLAQGSDSNLYGTTFYGGAFDYGTVFKITTNGVLTTLVSFNSGNGRNPEGGLIQGNDGNFYGTTIQGGANDYYGTVFKMTTNGALTTLISFGETNGSLPHAGLIYATDGFFYGTTGSGGPYGVLGATVFKMTSNGELSTVAAFNYTNGAALFSEVVQGRDGNLYGTTAYGGAYNYGTVFRIVMPVTLNSRVSGNELVLSWPTNALGFTLQAAADLNSPTNWMDSTNPPAVVGAQFTVTNTLSASSQFYRLKK